MPSINSSNTSNTHNKRRNKKSDKEIKKHEKRRKHRTSSNKKDRKKRQHDHDHSHHSKDKKRRDDRINDDDTTSNNSYSGGSSSDSSSYHEKREDTDKSGCSKRKKHHTKRQKRKRHGSSSEKHSTSRTDRKRKSHSYASSSSSDGKQKKHKKNSSARKSNNKTNTFLKSLETLFTNYPPMKTQFPFMLYKMVQTETTYDLSNMTPNEAGTSLQDVFEATAKEYGDDVLIQHSGDGSWGWNKVLFGQQAKEQVDGFMLLRIVKALLDDCGITMNAVDAYESSLSTTPQPTTTTTASLEISDTASTSLKNNSNPTTTIQNMIMTILIKQPNNYHVLAKEIFNLCNVINQNELVSLDGIQSDMNHNLQKELEDLFACIGLELVDMDDDEDDNEGDGPNNDLKEGASSNQGYGLPEEEEEHFSKAKLNLSLVVDTCQTILNDYETTTTSTTTTTIQSNDILPPNNHTATTVKGPQLPNHTTMEKLPIHTSDDDEDDMIGPSLPTKDIATPFKQPQHILQQMSKNRKQELLLTIQNKNNTIIDPKKREEWMLTPGEHDFLESIQRQPLGKERKFQNIKASSKEEVELDPIIQEELRKLNEANANARGPSLLEQHDTLKKEKKRIEAADETDGSWKWNRDHNLMDGRRVDKDALKMVLGGAKDGLQSKFQSGFTR